MLTFETALFDVDGHLTKNARAMYVLFLQNDVATPHITTIGKHLDTCDTCRQLLYELNEWAENTPTTPKPQTLLPPSGVAIVLDDRLKKAIQDVLKAKSDIHLVLEREMNAVMRSSHALAGLQSHFQQGQMMLQPTREEVFINELRFSFAEALTSEWSLHLFDQKGNEKINVPLLPMTKQYSLTVMDYPSGLYYWSLINLDNDDISITDKIYICTPEDAIAIRNGLT